MRQIALLLSYDGSAYHGWQIQKNSNSIQETLQTAIRQIVQEPVHLIGCGRTDAGVHARIYVASFRTESRMPVDRIPVALNSLIPEDLAVFRALEVPDSFHPIRSCLRKQYTYTIDTSPVRDPFFRGRALHETRPLDVETLHAAAQAFVGTHDFAAMRSLGTEVSSTVRTVYDFTVRRSGSFVQCTVSANGFLYNMARTMVGTLLSVAFGKLTPQELPAILESGDRTRAGATAPACGLALTRLWYDIPELKEVGYDPKTF